MKPIYRQAVESDLESIRQIFNYYILNSNDIYDIHTRDANYMKSWWLQKEEQKFPVIIALVEDKIAGFATYGTFRRWGAFDCTVEHSVYVINEYHSMGIGLSLMNRIIEEAKNKGFHSMIGGIDSANNESIHFHEKLGFSTVGKIPEVAYKNEEWLELIFMQKIL